MGQHLGVRKKPCHGRCQGYWRWPAVWHAEQRHGRELSVHWRSGVSAGPCASCMGKEDCLELSMVFNGCCAGRRVYCLERERRKNEASGWALAAGRCTVQAWCKPHGRGREQGVCCYDGDQLVGASWLEMQVGNHASRVKRKGQVLAGERWAWSSWAKGWPKWLGLPCLEDKRNRA